MRDSSQTLAAGMRYRRAGDLQKAEAACRSVLARQADNAEALHLLGLVARDAGHYDAAAALIVQAIHIRGPRPALCANLGAVLAQQGRTAQAVACYRQAAQLAPSDPDIRYNLAASLAQEGRAGEAIASYREAVRLRPAHVEAWNNLGNLLQRTGRLGDAIGCYRTALRHRPGNAGTTYNLGLCLQKLDRLKEAEQAYRAAIRAKRDLADAHNNLGNVLRDQGLPQEAIDAYREALRVNPAHADASVNLGIVHLLLGDFDQGWEEYSRRSAGEPARFGAPSWDGAPLGGRRILLYAEQGLGDTVQFIRYAPLVRDRGGLVSAEVQPALVRLLSSMRGLEGGLLAAGSTLPAFDCQASLLSLPRILRTRCETIPRDVPYVAADPALVAEWAARLAAPPGHRKIGVVWAGNPDHRNDRNRSLPCMRLAELGALDGAVFFNLQLGARASEADALPGPFRLLPLGREPRDFADTAAVLANLDLVISVDTSVAHVAGALGRPVWLLLPFAPAWRWMLDRDDSPWYPTMRLFRQPRPKDWAAVIAQVRAALQA